MTQELCKRGDAGHKEDLHYFCCIRATQLRHAHSQSRSTAYPRCARGPRRQSTSPMLAASHFRGSTFQVGEVAPASGLYRMIHLNDRDPHDVVVLQGGEFPSCRGCRAEVTFELLRAIRHLLRDMDLSGPLLEVVDAKSKKPAPPWTSNSVGAVVPESHPQAPEFPNRELNPRTR